MADGRAGSAAPLELASAVAHELKSPLAAIRGAAAALARESLAADDRTDLLRVIADASAQADRLVADLLLAGRLGAGRLAIDVREVDVAAIVDSVAQAAAVAHEDVTVRTQFRGGVRPQAMADPDRLHAALANLVDNASAYGPGEVGIATSVEAELVRIAVSDEGPGIPAGQRERVFEPYVRLSERTAGTGLGLHLARELARAMGGDVVLEPGDGPGATFVLELRSAATAGSAR